MTKLAVWPSKGTVMKVPILVAAVSIVSLSWLGMSFATPVEAPEDPHFATFASKRTVSAEHADSHRVGAKERVAVALPAWEESGL